MPQARHRAPAIDPDGAAGRADPITLDGRDALNLAALKDMTEGKGTTPGSFYKSANQFGFTFNWGYINRTATANFSSGLLPVRPKDLDRRLPTLGTGKYEWKGYLNQNQHPHETGGPKGLLLNWNNRSAPAMAVSAWLYWFPIIWTGSKKKFARKKNMTRSPTSICQLPCQSRAP